MMPLVWMEVRCDVQRTLSHTVNYRSRGACFETWSGMFARRASDAVRAAKADNWRIVDGQWVCPACQGLEDNQNEQSTNRES